MKLIYDPESKSIVSDLGIVHADVLSMDAEVQGPSEPLVPSTANLDRGWKS